MNESKTILAEMQPNWLPFVACFLLQRASGQAFTVTKTAKKLLTATAILAAIAVAATIFHRSGSRFALDRYKVELHAKGEKLTFKELAVSPSTNSAHISARAALASYSTNSGVPAVPVPKLIDFIAPGKARVAWGETVILDGLTTASNASDWGTLKRQCQYSEAFLKLVMPAMQNPPPDSGWTYTDNYSNAIVGPPQTFIRNRTLAQALLRAEILELHRGNLDGALEDLHALSGFAAICSNDLTVASQMIRVSIASIGLNCTWEALQAPGWDDARLASLQKDLENVEFVHGLVRGMEGERVFGQVVMAKVRTSYVGSLKYIINPPKAAPTAPVNLYVRVSHLWEDELGPMYYRLMGSANQDELFMLQHSTRVIEVARSIEAGRPWPEVAAASSNVMAQLEQAFREDRFHRLQVSAMAIPNFSRAFETVVHLETQRRLTITAIAIKRYELRHGKPPETLAALIPEFQKSALIDPMSGQPLCYRLNSDNTFVLYSTGDDGKDDGGKAGMTLWSSPDAVWPVAATPEEERAARTTVTRK